MTTPADQERIYTLDRELERLHDLIKEGKEIRWATAEISRLNQSLQPLVMVTKEDQYTNLKRRIFR